MLALAEKRLARDDGRVHASSPSDRPLATADPGVPDDQVVHQGYQI